MKKAYNKNLIIGVLLLAAVVFGFMWHSENQELAKLKTSVNSSQAQAEQGTAKGRDEKMDAAFDQINGDYKTVDIWKKLQCTPKTRLDCVGTNCTKSQPIVYLILDRPNKTFSRCDTKGCDTYDANFYSGGGI